jgi:hypothetical protein
MRQGKNGWAVYSIVNGLVLGTSFALATAAFSQVTVLVDYGGLFQFIAAIAIWSWLTMLALYLLKGSHETG